MKRGRLLLTGGRGFVGRHVMAAAAHGAFRAWEIVPLAAGVDLRDTEATANQVGEVMPDAILHLAAQSFVPRSFENPTETFSINLLGTLNLLQALKARGFSGRMVYASSGDVYGRVPDDALPVDERRIPEPRSPYAVSKIAAEQLCLQRWRTDGLDVMIARPFNHIGPGQDARFVVPALGEQVVEIADGRRPAVVEAGDIDATRDFTDVRDVVAAYACMLESGVAGETYVIGSGRERRIRDLLDMMCALEGISPRIEQDAARMRPAEQRRMAADAARLHEDTGWTPLIPITTTLRDILQDIRNSR
jgi:GDP-4-dehydro-6-deoxy-D-mannose reductase